MSNTFSPIHVIGFSSKQCAALADALDRPVSQGLPETLTADDIVLIDARGAERMPLGNAFSACRQIKRDSVAKVFIAVEDGDPFGAEIARFCMADDTLMIVGGRIHGLERLSGGQIARPRNSVDELLARAERQLAGDDGKQVSALQKMLETAGEAMFLERLTDAETGLFDGPYAAFKLDEEMKRSSRFHQPLSLMLLDCGVEPWPADADDRRAVLAEIASIFLNYCRDIDVLARFTEDVFLFLLPGTGPDGAATLARRMLGELERREFSVAITMKPAVGIVTLPQSGLKGRQAVLARAEACLRLAQGVADGERIHSSGEASA